MFDADGRLWCVELEIGCITRIGGNGELDRYEIGGRPSGLALGCDGQFWFCDSGRNEVRVFDSVAGRAFAVAGSADGHDLEAPNDLALDPAGNLIFSCHAQSRTAPAGMLAVLRPSGVCSIAGEALQFPNGLAFGADRRTLYLAETYKQRVWEGDWDAGAGRWRPRREILHSPGPKGPDGVAIASDGRVYAAVYGAGCIMSAMPGQKPETLTTDGRCPTSCAFDPSCNLGLVFTEAETGTIRALALSDRGLPLHRAPEAADEQG